MSTQTEKSYHFGKSLMLLIIKSISLLLAMLLFEMLW
jgi:hypothetical protein